MSLNIIKEVVTGILLLLILPVCYFGFFSNDIKMLLHSLLLVAFGIVAALLWYDRPADEREITHQLISAKAGFTAGGVILASAIVYSGFSETYVSDPALYWAFGAMLVGRIGGKLWAHRYR